MLSPVLAGMRVNQPRKILISWSTNERAAFGSTASLTSTVEVLFDLDSNANPDSLRLDYIHGPLE